MDTIRNPKYDNDYITKGYLDKQLLKEKDNVDKTIEKLPKSYNSPPLTPYYKGSLLNYNGKLYRCIKDKLVGEFSFNDWQIIATDDTSINNFIKNTYSVDKLELEKQIDDKVESWYQEDDPELNWATDILKAKHVGDYWYDTSTNNQFRYSKMPTNPVTYKWLKVDVPLALYDQINAKKSIYTSKPSTYKKDDLWIIEDSISDNDLPIGESENPIAKGDWVFAIQDSDSYNKAHWVKRDMDVSLDYLKTHYYTKETIEETYSTKNQVSSDIKKAKDEIELNVKNEYSTKNEITEIVKDYDEKIGTINATIETHGTTLSDLSVENGQIKQSVSNINTEINENYQEINQKITTTNEQVGQITTQMNNVNINVSNLTTKTQEIDGNIEKIEQKLDDMSYDFTTAGLKVGKSTDDNNTVLDNNGIRSYNKTELNAIFNKNGSGINKLIVTGTAQIGYLKIKKTIRNGKKRTSIYHLEELIENLTDLEG